MIKLTIRTNDEYEITDIKKTYQMQGYNITANCYWFINLENSKGEKVIIKRY